MRGGVLAALASDSSRFRADNPLRPQKSAQVGHYFVEASGVTPRPQQLKLTCLAIETRLGATDQAVADEYREHVIAELALLLRNIHLEPVAKLEQSLGPSPAVHKAVERGQERGALGDGSVTDPGVRVPLSLVEPDSEGTESLFRKRTLSFGERHRFGFRIQRSAMSQRRCPLRRPTTAMWPRA